MWENGYWTGNLINGYPESYYDNGYLQYPWEKDIKKSETLEEKTCLTQETKHTDSID